MLATPILDSVEDLVQSGSTMGVLDLEYGTDSIKIEYYQIILDGENHLEIKFYHNREWLFWFAADSQLKVLLKFKKFFTEWLRDK